MSSRSGSKSKGKNVSHGSSNPEVEHLAQGFAGTKVTPSQDDAGGEWEVISKKNKNKSGKSHNQNPPRAWGGLQQGRGNNVYGRGNATDFRVSAGRGTGRGQAMNRGYSNNYVAPPPLEGGWNWQLRAGSSQYTFAQEVPDVVPEEEDDEADALDDDSDEDDLVSDDYDSDVSQKSHGTRKKQNKWFQKFFERLDSLSIEQINEPEKKWHCPACQGGGPGAIEWYNLQTLLAHARTKGAKRVKLHRELAEVLDNDLQIRGASVIPCGEIYGKWKGLADEKQNDYAIVWPPMVIIMNTKLDKDDNDKWLGMGNEELLDYFDKYHPIRARHSYNPQGHRGMSVLIFESNASGYVFAEFLDKMFAQQGLGRNGWECCRHGLFRGGVRQLYGFLAKKQDLDNFNQHSHGKTRLEFEMRSYHEKVVEDVSQIYEDNQHLKYYKDKYTKEKKRADGLEETVEIMSQKLRNIEKDNRSLRERTKTQRKENREEMDSQDRFFRETINRIGENRDANEENFEHESEEEEL